MTNIVTLSAKLSATLTVRDAAGNILPPPPDPPAVWHESLRYFRLAQVTDDLFDAYRNLYLALESILDRIAPQKMKPGGTPPKPDEGESTWFKRALGEANKLVNLSPFVGPGCPDPVQELFDQLYGETRTALFHAKSSRRFFLPHETGPQHTVMDSVARLSRLYLALAQSHFGLRIPSGGIFRGGFKLLTQGWDAGFQIHATDDAQPAAADDQEVNPSGGQVVTLATRPAPELDQPFLKSFLGTADGAKLRKLKAVTRVVGTLNGSLVACGIIEGCLTIEGIARFEGQMGIRLKNAQMPKLLFGS